MESEADQVYVAIGDSINIYDIATNQIVTVLDYNLIRPTRIRLWEAGEE